MHVIEQLTSRKVYKLSFLFVVFLNTLGLSFFAIDITPLYLILILWGGILMMIETIQKKLWYNGNHLLYLLGFLICLSFATVSNREFSTPSSFLLLVMQGIIFLFLFTQKKGTSLLTIKNEMRSIQKMTCILTFTASLLSIMMFMCNLSVTRNGVTLGLVQDRLFGVYFNCNPAAFLACMSIVFSFIALRNRYAFAGFYIVNIIVQFTYIVLTGTRSVLLILLGLLISLIYYTLFKRREYTTLQKSMIILSVSFLFMIGVFIIRNLLYMIPQLQGAVFEDSGRFQLHKLIHILSLIKENPWANRQEIFTALNALSSSRLELWYDAYKIWRTSPFIGIGTGNFKAMGQALIQTGMFEGATIVHTHNFLMESLVTSGVFGFTFFFAFVFRSFTALLETLRRYTHTKSYFLILMIGFIIFIEAMGGFLDYGVFYIYSMSSVLFWIYLGYLYWFNDHPRMKLVNDSMMYDFINYHLGNIAYHRKPEDAHCDVKLQIEYGRYFKDRDVYAIRLCIHTSFAEDDNSHFVYDGLFHIMKAHAEEEQLEEYKKEMALELYEIIKDEIEAFLSDASDTIHLPPADMRLFDEH